MKKSKIVVMTRMPSQLSDIPKGKRVISCQISTREQVGEKSLVNKRSGHLAFIKGRINFQKLCYDLNVFTKSKGAYQEGAAYTIYQYAMQHSSISICGCLIRCFMRILYLLSNEEFILG